MQLKDLWCPIRPFCDKQRVYHPKSQLTSGAPTCVRLKPLFHACAHHYFAHAWNALKRSLKHNSTPMRLQCTLAGPFCQSLRWSLLNLSVNLKLLCFHFKTLNSSCNSPSPGFLATSPSIFLGLAAPLLIYLCAPYCMYNCKISERNIAIPCVEYFYPSCPLQQPFKCLNSCPLLKHLFFAFCCVKRSYL